MADGDFVRLSGPVNSRENQASLDLPVHVSGHAAGNTVVVGASHTNSPDISSVSDSKGNSYTEVLNNTSGSGQKAGIWFSVLDTGLVSGDTITVTYTGSLNGGQVHMAAEFEGAGALDSPGVSATGGTGDPSSGNKTPASAPTVAVGWVAREGEDQDMVVDAFSSWTLIAYDNSGLAGHFSSNIESLMERQALSTTDPVAATADAAGSDREWWAGIAVFTFGAGADPIDLDHLSGSQFFSPTVADSSVDLDHLDGSDFFEPSLVSVEAIDLDLLDGSQFFEPEIVGTDFIDLDLLDGSQFFEPTLEGTGLISLDLLDSSEFFEITVSSGTAQVDFDFLEGSEFFEPQVDGSLVLDLLSSSQFFEPELDSSIVLDTLEAGQFFGPQVVFSDITLDLLDGSQFFEPLVGTSIVLDHLAGSVFFEPQLDGAIHLTHMDTSSFFPLTVEDPGSPAPDWSSLPMQGVEF